MVIMKLIETLLTEIYDNRSKSAINFKNNQRLILNLQDKTINDLRMLIGGLEKRLAGTCAELERRLERRDTLRRQQTFRCDVISVEMSKRTSTDLRFTIEPTPGDSGFSQWITAMKMVARLNEGIPNEFRRRLWLTLADKYLATRDVDWEKVEKECFNEWTHPADAELGVQIVKDLHRTGCSLFCGEDGRENQALLKRVLLAYARWNKSVGYCQGFNMLAALILQVTEKCETDALKLMIYLIEGVLPESYFADNLRGLSVDMAVFRELLRTHLPKLSKHLDTLQNQLSTDNYEPPLTNVFTMQWFLTLFCNCLQHTTVLRVWDLILLEGNEILLRTAIGIWQHLENRILQVRSADEFYCLMGALTRELFTIDANLLIKSIVAIGTLNELNGLREHYTFNIHPWGNHTLWEKQLKIYPKERLVLDISALKQQYGKLKQRQRQAHIIFNAAISRQSPATPTPVAMNHLLLGKSALVTKKRLGPPKGAIPPKTLQWKDADKTKSPSSSSSSDTELCDEPGLTSSSSDEELVVEKKVSTKALQIIEENSMILHRIMQCQSQNHPTLPDDKVVVTNDQASASGYVSKYEKILEKSRHLDEKYNSLIVNATTYNRRKDDRQDGDPFPISVTSRQNKSVPLRLGLYKKCDQ